MRKLQILTGLVLLGMSLTSCGPQINRVVDDRNLTDQEYTINNIVALDNLERVVKTGAKRNKDKEFGLFYHIWHGYHTNGIYNITDLLENDPESLWDHRGTPNSPYGEFHYWGEPLFGYYNSSDPWLIARHIELLTMAGVDYLVYDLTNATIYFDAINAIFAVLDEFQQQGFNVPKVAFYTNTASGRVIQTVYNTWYKNGLYENLWYSLNGVKPLIIGKKGDIYNATQNQDLADEILNFFEIKESQWPSDPGQNLEEGFPWMSWVYPQQNFSGVMSVSLAQHPGMRMSEGEISNNGRGFNYKTYLNETEGFRSGPNFQGQWDNVFANKDSVNNVFMTGFNEWIAIKYADGADRVYFVDTFNEEYSRDIEMVNGGYGDNFYIQMLQNMREFGWSDSERFIYPQVTIDINDESMSGWNLVKNNFVDFRGDARARDFISADKINKLIDNSNRNDIVKTSVTHDKTNLYIKVETAEPLTQYKSDDRSFMNILIGTGATNSFNGFNYVINRSITNTKTSIEKLNKNYNPTNVGEGKININGNVLQVEIPLKLIGKSSKDFNVVIKVTDNVQNPENILDYYVSGDSAPIGRLGYSYGY